MLAADQYAQAPTLSTLRGLHDVLDREARTHLVLQLLTTLREYYVHLPLKQARFAVDPLRELELLGAGEPLGYRDLPFLDQLLTVISGLRDRHTTLTLPEPWARIVAYVPVLIERFHHNGVPVYVVSRTIAGAGGGALEPGMRVTHWNGVPIDRYLFSVLAEASQGANRAAASLLALSSLTVRPLAYMVPPEEDWVTLSCIAADGAARVVTLPWKYYVQPPSSSLRAAGEGEALALSTLMGVDERLANVQRNVKELFAVTAPAASSLGDYLRYGAVETSSGRAGHLRFFNFEVGDVATFLAQMAEILAGLPQDRLIVDLRGNPGGLIPAGEGLVQMLTKRPVQAAPVSFRSTVGTYALSRLPDFAPWQRSLERMYASGEVYSQGFPLTDVSRVPAYRYPGKTVLIIDGLSYSTCDFFAADFQDNGIGPIVGTDLQTGGGGANVWGYDVLVQYALRAGGPPLAPLPLGLGLNVSVRRCVRTGRDHGLPIEDFGTRADLVHPLTASDLMDGNVDLLSFAVRAIG